MISIEYRTIIPGQQHFDCSAMKATLSTAACADRYSRASATQNAAEGRYASCHRCPVGHQHAHQDHQVQAVESTPPQRLDDRYCVRCGRSELRIVHSRQLCVSCLNREAEHRRGRNARGNPLRDYTAPVPRRVSVVEPDGRHTWRMFEGANQAEAIARASRAGLKLHGDQPGRTRWNIKSGRFEYADAEGRTLLAIEIDGRIEFVPVLGLHPGEEPAEVVAPVIRLTADDAQVWLGLLDEDEQPGPEWKSLGFACSKCGSGVLQGRHRVGLTAVRCTVCG